MKIRYLKTQISIGGGGSGFTIRENALSESYGAVRGFTISVTLSQPWGLGE